MGACTFMNRGKGASAKDAFNSLVREAQYEHGHGGYTGTIAEKSEFVMIRPPFAPDPQGERKEYLKSVRDYADKLIGEDNDPRVCDKWGPAGCIDLGEGEFLFFGWASS